MQYYEQKKEFHYRQWEVAQESSKQSAADFHMKEYLNYKEMSEQVK